LWLHLAVPVLFAGLAAIMTWPLLPNLASASLDYPTYGDTLISSYLMSWQAHALVTDPGHLLDTNTLYPFTGTLAYDELNFAPALLAAPVFWLTHNSMLAHNALTLVTFVLAGYGAWLLGRALTGSGWAGLVAGVIYAFSFYRFDHLKHITLINGQWLPFVLLCLHGLWRAAARPQREARTSRTWLWAAGFVLFFTLQCYSSHYFAFAGALTVGLFALYYPLAERRLNGRFFGWLIGAGAASAALLAPIGLAYVAVQGAQRFARPLWDTERYSNTLQSFLAVWEGNPLYKALLSPFADSGPWPWERSAFPGLVPLVLSAVGVVSAFRRRGAIALHPTTVGRGNNGISPDSPLGLSGRGAGGEGTSARRHIGFYLLLTGVALLLSLGPTLYVTFDGSTGLPLPYRLLYDWVPGVQSMRAVTRIGIVWTLGLAVLSAYGVAYLLPRLRSNAQSAIRNPQSAFAIVACALALFEVWSAPVPMLPLATGGQTPPVYTWLAGQPQAVTVEYPMVYKQRGPRNVAMNNEYLYYAATHWQPLLNGDYTLRPSAYSAMQQETENCFPCPRSLDALWALGTGRVVAHLENLTGPDYRTEFLWRADPANIPATGLNPGEFALVKDFGDTKVYALGPRPLAALRDYLPPGASLFLAEKADDPLKTGAYTAALGWWLRDHPQYGDPAFSYGQPVTPWTPGTPVDAAILYAGQAPAPYGFTAADAAWQNEHVVLYVHR
jgi:hypothetical protein